MSASKVTPTTVTPAIKKTIDNLRVLVGELALNGDVTAALIPQGRPHDFETELWDEVLPPAV